MQRLLHSWKHPLAIEEGEGQVAQALQGFITPKRQTLLTALLRALLMTPTWGMMMAGKRKKKKKMMMMKKRRWSTQLQAISKKTLGMTRTPMHQGLLELLAIEPSFFFFFFRFILFSQNFGLSCNIYIYIYIYIFLILSINFCVHL